MQLSYSAVQTLAATYAPLMYLRSDEKYLPCDVNWYLSQSSVRDANGNVLYDPASADDLVAANVGPTCYVHPHSDSLPKPPSGAPVYVRFTPVEGQSGFYDMEYWFFYWYNGPSTVRLVGEFLGKGVDLKFEIPPVGEHEGDWEHITVRFDENQNVVAVFYAQHGAGQWLAAGSYPTAPGSARPLGYSAVNSHATYPSVGTFEIGGFDFHHLGVKVSGELVDRTGQDTAWDTSTAVVVISVDPSICPDAPAAIEWTAFAGEWGQPTDQKELVKDAKAAFEAAVGSALSAVLWPEIEKFLEKLPEPGGPTGPNPSKKGWNGEPTHP